MTLPPSRLPDPPPTASFPPRYRPMTPVRLACVVLFVAPLTAAAAEPTFETHIRPILRAYCVECHGDAAKPKAGLDLRLRRLIVAGGESGPAVVPGRPDESLLVAKVRDQEMPPGKKKLSAKDVET